MRLSRVLFLLTENTCAIAVANGRPSGGAWFDSSIELPNEPMMYGHLHFSPTSDGSTVPSIYTISKTQLALFMVCPRFIVNRSYTQWLRDVVSSASFAGVGGYGGPTPTALRTLMGFVRSSRLVN